MFVTQAVERRGRKMKIGLYLHLEGWVTNENGSKGWSGDYHSPRRRVMKGGEIQMLKLLRMRLKLRKRNCDESNRSYRAIKPEEL